METNKPIVLTLVRYYLPGYKSGGPVRTITNIVDHLGDDIEFRIVTSDRDALDDEPYSAVSVDAWNRVGKARVYYVSPAKQTIRGFLKLIADTPYDILYLNSFFDPIFTQRPLIARRLGLLPTKPIVIAPRGEFSPGALAIKRWKKVSYRWFASALRLYRGLIWQASSDREAEEIRCAMGPAIGNVSVARDLPPLSIANESRDNDSLKNGGLLRVVFLSRITPMKNLDFALRVLARVNTTVQFDIYGPIEVSSYWRQCQVLMTKLPSNVSVQYHGTVVHSETPKVFASHDLLFLPTRGENYGHVIMESLTAGTPVLIADTTPWRHLKEDGVGWDLPLDDEQQFTNKIHDAAQLSTEAYRLWRRRVWCYARARSEKPEAIAANRRLFMEAAGITGPAEP
jgi:glycosyltransferase involved in cell wall biosynthesis